MLSYMYNPKMNVRQNEVNEKSDKCYSVKAPESGSPSNLVNFKFINGSWKVSLFDEFKEYFESFEAASGRFERVTGRAAPRPVWLNK